MILYHGGLSAVREPRIIRGDRVGDFGTGFYTTTDIEQARKLTDQMLFHTEGALGELRFVEALEVTCKAR